MNDIYEIIKNFATFDICGTTIAGTVVDHFIEAIGRNLWKQLKDFVLTLRDQERTYWTCLFSCIEKSFTEIYPGLSNNDERLVMACETILVEWRREKSVKYATVFKAIKYINEKCDESQVLEWYISFATVVSKSEIYSIIILNMIMETGSKTNILAERTNEIMKGIRQIKELIDNKYKSKCENILYPQYITDRPFDITRGFVGREERIQEIIKNIFSNKSTLISGMGGIGKTEIAKVVLHIIENTEVNVSGITDIAWINYDNADIKYCIITAFSDLYNMPNNIDKAWMEVLRIISEKREKLLLVIDNVESDMDENLLKLSDLQCRILVTGRVEFLSSLKVISIDELDEKSAVSLFCKYYTKNMDLYEIKKILSLVEYHTVSIELLAKIANNEELTLTEFHQKLVENGFRFSNEETAAGHKRLRKERRIIEQLSHLFYLFNLTEMMQNLLIKISVIPSLPFNFGEAQLWFGENNHKRINKLVELGWLQKNEMNRKRTYAMHSVVAAAIREQAKDKLYEKCRDFIVVITKELKYEQDENGSEKKHLIHFSWSISDLLNDHFSDEVDADFLYRLACVYFAVANYKQALTYLFWAIRIYKHTNCSELKMSTVYNQIGLTYQEMKQYQYSITQYNVCKRIIFSHPEGISYKAALLNNIGLSLMHLNNPKAITILEEAYKCSTELYGQEHSESIKIYFNYGNCLRTYGYFKKAYVIYMYVCDVEKKKFPNSLRLATSYNCMGDLLYECGDYENAKYYLKCAKKIRVEKLGEEHPQTCDVINTLALIDLDNGDTCDARKKFETILKHNIDTYGEKHPEVAIIYENIGLCWLKEGNFEQSMTFLHLAKEIIENFYGEHWYELGNIFLNIGDAYYEKGDRDEAWINYQRAEEILKANYVFCIDDYLHLQGSMAKIVFERGEREEASKIFNECIQKSIEYWNGEHISLAHIYNNYSLMLEYLSDTKNALIYAEKSLRLLLKYRPDDKENITLVKKRIYHLKTK